MADVMRYNSESKVFWQKTEALLNELQDLQKDIQLIDCPCSNPDCPFNSKNRSSTELYFQFPNVNFTHVHPRVRKNGTHYNGFSNGHSSMPMLGMRIMEDCEVAHDEPTPFSDVTYKFKRAKPVRRRKHTSLQMTQSLPPESLPVPLPPIYSPSGRSISMPTCAFGDCPGASGLARLQHSRAHLSPSCSRLSMKTAN